MSLACASSSALRHHYRHHDRAPGRQPARARQPQRVVCGARPDSPYEPLEKAVQVINRVIALGEQAGWGAGDEPGRTDSSSGSRGAAPGASQQQPAQQQSQRWVQFGAVYNSRVTVEQPALPAAGSRSTQLAAPAATSQAAAPPSGGSNSSSSGWVGAGPKQLRNYLALPVEQYSLLDPKWISREEGGLFRFCLPLQDLVNVDMQPEIYFSVLAEPEHRRVTLAGTRAALGSPELDQAFKLNVKAVISQRQQRRLPMPDHLPGRPVYRLRRWAAAARGRTWPPAEGSPGAAVPAAAAAARAGKEVAATAGAEAEPAGVAHGSLGGPGAAPDAALEGSGGAVAAAAAAAAAGAAPFPSQHVYISHDENDEDEFMGPAELAADELAVADVALAELEEAEASQSSSGSSMPMGGGDAAAAVATGWWQQQQQTPPPSSERGGNSAASGTGGVRQGQEALLHCRAHVTMAVQVPSALRVVPNALLGYAGSLLLRAVLSATLPNFLELLAADYRRWAGLAPAAGADGRPLDAPVGELFLDAAAAVREGQERRSHHPQAQQQELQRQQQQHVEGAEGQPQQHGQQRQQESPR